MKDLLFISLLEKDDILKEEQIKDFFRKDVTLRALKKGYPEDTKFKLILKEMSVDNKLFSVCFVFNGNVSENDLLELTSEDLLKKSVLMLFEENDVLQEGDN